MFCQGNLEECHVRAPEHAPACLASGSVTARRRHGADGAWTFTRWLGKEGEVLLAQGGAVFPAYLPAVDDFVKSKPDLNLKIYADERANAHPIPVSPYIDQVNKAINPEMQALWKGTETVQVAVQRISQQLNQVLAKTPSH
jgi:multiple sugar transport system substrate-binding protein